MLAGLFVCTACSFDLFSDPEPDDPRLLDRACPNVDDCEVTGAAQRTTGITEDSVGYRLGPGDGSLTIPLQPTGVGPDFVFEILVAGEGSAQLSSSGLGISESIELPSSYDWRRITGTIASGASSDQELTIAVTGESRAELADIRAKGLDYPVSCAVRVPGR